MRNLFPDGLLEIDIATKPEHVGAFFKDGGRFSCKGTVTYRQNFYIEDLGGSSPRGGGR